MAIQKNLTIGIVVEKMKEFEIKFGVLNQEHYGHKARLIWEASRFNIYNYFVKKAGLYGTAHTPTQSYKMLPFFKKILFFFKFSYRLFFKNWFLSPRNKMFLVFSTGRRIKNHKTGIYEDIYTDDIIKELGEDKCIILEYSHKNIHYHPFNYNILYNEINMFLVKLLKPFFDTKKIYFLDQLIYDINNFFEKEFGFSVDVNEILYTKAEILFRYKSVYKLMLKYLKPQKVLLVCSYGLESLIIASKELNIPTYEIQHGTITDFHLGYSFPKTNSKYSFPDYLLVFGQFWKDTVNFPLANKNINVLGYPYLQNKINDFQKYTKKNQILFLSQGSIGKYLSKFAINFSKLNNSDLKIIYKLHPGEYDRWSIEYPWLKLAHDKNQLIVLDNNDHSLYELLSTSKWQVGVYSTAIFEGLVFGCNTYLVNLPGIEYMKYLIEFDFAKVVNSPTEIKLLTETQRIDCKYFFDSSWKINLKYIFSLK